jgi:hypothetical protein
MNVWYSKIFAAMKELILAEYEADNETYKVFITTVSGTLLEEGSAVFDANNQ